MRQEFVFLQMLLAFCTANFMIFYKKSTCYIILHKNYCTTDVENSTTVCGEKKTPLNKYHYFRYSSIFFYKIFRDYSRHNLPLLLQILSSHLSLYRSSTALNIKDDFFQLRRQINQTTTNFQRYFKHMTRSKCRKHTSY